MNNRVLPPPSESEFVSYKNFQIAKAICDHLPEIGHCTILDIGCGTGQIDANIVNNRNVEIVGIDYFKETVALAKTKFKNRHLKFVHADVFKMPFKKGEFDFVLSLGPSAGNLPGAIEKIKGVLKPNGRIYLEYINHFSIYNLPKIITKMKKHIILFKNALANNNKSNNYSSGAVHYNFGLIGIKKYLEDENKVKIQHVSYLYSLPPQLNSKSIYTIDRIFCRFFGPFLARSILIEVQI